MGTKKVELGKITNILEKYIGQLEWGRSQEIKNNK
jgi:hypothetical protein